MKKIIEVLILCSLVFCLFPVKANAFGLIPQGTVLCTGTMDDGTGYTIYIDDLNLGNDSIKIVHSKRFSIHVIFEGNIIPPSTWPVTITDDNIEYSGILYLDSYEFDNFLGDKSTIAFYSGTLHALL